MEKLGFDVDQENAAVHAKMDEGVPGTADFHSKEVISLAKAHPDFLGALAMPNIWKFLLPKVLLAVWSLLIQLVDAEGKFPQVALGIPRGHAKTTVIKLFILYCILFTDKKFILVISATSTLAENVISDVMDMLEENNIKKVFGDWKVGFETNRGDLKKFGFRGRNIILAAIGAEGSMRGLNIKNVRPDVMIFEDAQTKECSESRVQSMAFEDWMVSTAMKAKSPAGCLTVFVGNMYRSEYSTLKKLRTNPSWVKFISGAILADGTALWEELRSLQSLIDELNNDIAMGHPEAFFAEVMNDTEVGSNNRVDFAMIREWPWQEDELPQGKFIIIDPSANKKGGDDVAIGYFEVYDGDPGLRELLSENLSPGNTIRRALLMALTNGVKLIAVESTAYQATLLYWFGIIADQLGITGISFVEVHTGMSSKNARITEALKSLTAGELYLHPTVRSHVTHQIAHWNPLKKDNVDGDLDLLAYARKVMEIYSFAIATDYDLDQLESNMAEVEFDNVCF